MAATSPDCLRVFALLTAACCACQAQPEAPVRVTYVSGQPVSGFAISDAGLIDVGVIGDAMTERDATTERDAMVVVPSGASALRIAYTTTSQGGRFAPRNIGAAWIERDDGTWVRTIEAWAGIRARYLTRFNAASGGNRVDAISRATLRMHERHETQWDLRDSQRARVPDGNYRLVVEVTDDNRPGAFVTWPLSISQLGPIDAADAPYFVDIELTLR